MEQAGVDLRSATDMLAAGLDVRLDAGVGALSSSGADVVGEEVQRWDPRSA